MGWIPFVALNVVFATVAVAVWIKCVRPQKSKLQCRAHLRKPFDMNPADVPEFKSTWRNARSPHGPLLSENEKHKTLVRDVSREQFVEALETSIMRNSSGVMPTLRARLDLLQNALPPLEKGNVLTFTYLPGSGTVLRGQGQEMTIPGKDFADALLSAWLGPAPVSGDLKRQLLGG